ncbi:putative MFS family arabinose efflux permease [Mumia flava]|uniref:Putative MFS family arabinose efflux permease n=1 Tax=Mumia flava TaxID=1348852 RepID=A0A2M9B8D9_9ACTN|nr:MFS transporter [Mumia flava]PJJ54202.1 putative MFS family arabinose efflux permease [Mumia flava]
MTRSRSFAPLTPRPPAPGLPSVEAERSEDAPPSAEAERSEDRDPGLPIPSRTLLLLMAASTGLSVAGNYIAQPLLELIAHDLGLTTTTAALIVTMSQVGYAVGLLLLVPLGDLVERRGLAVALFAGTTVSLLASSVAPGGTVLLATTALTALFSVAAQVVVPFAVTLATPERRGRVVATVMSGLLLGSILSRPVAGAIGEVAGWRAVYAVLAVGVAAIGAALWRRLPRLRTPAAIRYPRLIGSTLALLVAQPVVRRRSVIGALSLASFNVFWTALTFLLARRYGLSETVIGMFGLVGLAGVVATPIAGRLVDAGRLRTVTVGSAALLAGAWPMIALGGGSPAWLVAGALVLVVGQTALMNANQNAVLGLDPALRNRVNSAFMTAFFAGGALGSAATPLAWTLAGWPAVSALGGALAAAALATAAATSSPGAAVRRRGWSLRRRRAGRAEPGSARTAPC